jgi:hypothetical protein
MKYLFVSRNAVRVNDSLERSGEFVDFEIGGRRNTTLLDQIHHRLNAWGRQSSEHGT